ncbi:ABC transporter substrate-binding protein [Nocardioides marmoriginsengisoli]|uniref:ABC transporter substrate-binding protein n=1 Tax=Nocardioides marmoriginsengisoli TaxID=661483 RepID=A0A3N0CI19_9ACTN|nr:transporter substrate-binding domain-containing protein [Nocardioides marmoriginsengisoli]RNL63127.1 ABC transporter substrate-binding protein [Nocardioides marmoriginsengisoli]
MTTRNVWKTLALTSVLGLALAACGDSGDDGKTGSADIGLINAGTLTVCSDVPYPPFEDFDKSSPTGYKGFDIDVVSAIAEKLDVKVAVKDSDFDALQSGVLLNGRQCDLGASAMTITDERKKNLLFSDGYYTSKQSLLVPTGSDVKSIADLSGVKVGVQKGTTGETYTKENAPDAKPVQFADDGKMYLALKAGTIEAILQDLPVNLDHQNDPKEPGKYTVVETYDTAEEYGFAARKDNQKLMDAINEQLAAIKSDGEYQKIYDTYFAVK